MCGTPDSTEVRKRPTILFVGHDAYRAGAQIALLHLVTWLRSQLSARFIILLKEGGDLLTQYQAIAPTYVLGSERRSSSILSWCSDRLSYVPFGRRVRRPGPLRSLEDHEVNLMYINSVASLDVLRELKEIWQCPVICHVHELEMGIQRALGGDAFAEAAKRVDSFVAVSKAVTDNLCRSHGLATDRVHTIHEAITLPESTGHKKELNPQDLRHLGIPADGFVVGGAGTLDWRKGPDVFVHIARHLTVTRPDLRAHFVWVGGQVPGQASDSLLYDVERLGLASRVRFVGARPDLRPYFAGFDVFLLPSREDPFPLVCLEAATLGVPTVCFEKAGGIPEFVGTDAGFVVPYLDIPGAATVLASLADSPELRLRLGQRAGEKVKAHDIRVLGKRILQLIEMHLRQGDLAPRNSEVGVGE